MMPAWLSSELPAKCKCGHPIIDNENLTARRCSNLLCKYHMAVRVEKLAKLLNIVGFGEKTALSYVENYKFAGHMEYITVMCKEKPTILLEDFPKYLQIEGVTKQLDPYLKGKCDLEDAIKALPPNLARYALPMRLGARFVNFKQIAKRSDTIYNVMMTGEVHGWSTRQAFLSYLNERFGKYCQFNDVGVRKTNVFCLIKEDDTPMHNKTKIALERNIPIFTPTLLLQMLIKVYEEDDTSDS